MDMVVEVGVGMTMTTMDLGMSTPTRNFHSSEKSHFSTSFAEDAFVVCISVISMTNPTDSQILRPSSRCETS